TRLAWTQSLGRRLSGRWNSRNFLARSPATKEIRDRLVAISQRVTQPFQLHRHVHRLDGDVSRRLELSRREVEDRLDAGLHDPIENALRLVGGNGQDGDVRMILAHVALELRDV